MAGARREDAGCMQAAHYLKRLSLKFQLMPEPPPLMLKLIFISMVRSATLGTGGLWRAARSPPSA